MTEVATPPTFFNRELSWLEFNARVLDEAMNPDNPLLERLKFTGIVSSNLDEFFMVRVASLEPASEVFTAVQEKAYALSDRQYRHFREEIVPALEAAGIRRVTPEALQPTQQDFVRRLFEREVFPVLTPVALTGAKTAATLHNLSLYLAFALVPPPGTPGDQSREYAAVEVPRNLPRVVALPSEEGYPILLLEDLIRMYAARLFEGYEIEGEAQLRLTRGAEMTLDEERDEDFAKVMAEALLARRRGAIMRLEHAAPPDIASFLTDRLSVRPDRCYRVEGWFDLKGVSALASIPGFDELKRPAWRPRPSPAFDGPDDVWTVIRRRDVLLHLPYESFDPVVRFVREAAEDPEVLAVKQTLYRTASPSRLVAALERAAEAGKRVTVLVELKARFDEEDNIQWARRLEQTGASVVYGLAGLKTHAKACLVVRREPDGIRRYAHLATGNYNETTARLYSDHGFFTCDEDLTHDVAALFNMITGFSRPQHLTHLSIAPIDLRRRLLQLIRREALRSVSGNFGRIDAKMNSLVDDEIIEALYEASRAGVRVRLNVRGVCRLVPGVPGRSEHIRVVSIVDRFLEHSRIFYFKNGGDDEVFLSSADWMPRNLDRRVETMFPIEDPDLARELVQTLDLYFRDNRNSWELEPDGSYTRRTPGDEEPFRVQEHFCRVAEQREERQRIARTRELRPKRPGRHTG